jgi:hypothetical protein
MLARSAAEVNRVPKIGELSRATTRFPGGETVYSYGSLILDYLSRTRGADKIPAFINKTSSIILPLSLNARAKNVFGISFENAWRDWRDSLVRASGKGRDPLASWHELTREGRYVEFPRWLGDTALIYAASNGKEVSSAYRVNLQGEVTRLGRRNGLDTNVPLSDGSVVFAQADYVDPFHVRNDLSVEKNGVQHRLTRGARLAQPDVRSDGAIVAVQSIPGSTRLVRVSRDGRTIAPITSGDAQVQWAEPRWSPEGRYIAAVRVTRGGISQIVTLTEDGTPYRSLVSERAIVATPSWSSGGDSIYYTSTRSGSTQVYAVSADSRAWVSLLSEATTGIFHPESSPDAQKLAAVHLKYDGYHIGTGLAVPHPAASNTEPKSPRASCTNCRLAATISPMSPDQVGPARAYSPWQSLAPRYWEPIVGYSDNEGYSLGAATSGEDIIGRHSFYAEAYYQTARGETEGFGAYQYAGLGQPYLNFSASQEWEHFSLVNNANEAVGSLARRAVIGGIGASFVRPRARTFASFSFGGDVESRSYNTDPDSLLARLPVLYGKTRRYPSLYTSASWTNTKRPSLSISREDGISLSATARQRWEAGEFSDASRSVVGVAGLFKSLDLPGFAHHVIAARLAGGYADRRSISTFSVGGLSGGNLAVLAGVTVGDERRTFGVRGFPPSAEQGIRALAGTLEYRAPIAAPSRRVPFIPILFDRISISAFGEAGRAYCPASVGDTQICNAGRRDAPWLASTGAELDFDTALQYDVPARFRLGVAVPVLNRSAGDAKAASVYLTVGSSF